MTVGPLPDDPPQRRVHDPGLRERGRGQAGRGRDRDPVGSVDARPTRTVALRVDFAGLEALIRGPRWPRASISSCRSVDDLFQCHRICRRPRLGAALAAYTPATQCERVPRLERRRRDRLRQPPGFILNRPFITSTPRPAAADVFGLGLNPWAATKRHREGRQCSPWASRR